MNNKKLRISTILIVLLLMVVIALLIFLGVLIVKLLGNDTTNNKINNTNSINTYNEIVNKTNENYVGSVNQTTNNTTNPEVKTTVPSDYTFSLDSRKKYKIQTDTRFLSAKEDGSYTDVYYQVDLENGVMGTVTVQYPAKSAKDQNSKKSATYKVMNQKFQSEVKAILNEVISRSDVRSDGQTTYYRIQSLDSEKRIYNEVSIKDLKEIIKRFSELE